MIKNNKLFPIAIVLLCGLVIQVWFASVETTEVPSMAAIEFTKAFFKADKPTIVDRLCSERKMDDGLDIYINQKKKEASDRGFSVFYLTDKLYQIKTSTTFNDNKSKATVNLSCKIKPPLKSFFTKEDYHKIDQTFDMVLEGNKWKVCSNLFSAK